MNPLYLLICINVILGIGILWTPYGSVKPKCAEVTSALEEYWLKHYLSKEGMCSLCGQWGKIDSTGVETPAGVIVGRVNYCICPNGTKMRELKAAI